MIFRQLFDPQSSTYTYLLADSATREALLIDPVFEHARRDGALIEELGLKLRHTLETHVHADHVTGAWLLKRRFGSSDAAWTIEPQRLASRKRLCPGVRPAKSGTTRTGASRMWSRRYCTEDMSRSNPGISAAT